LILLLRWTGFVLVSIDFFLLFLPKTLYVFVSFKLDGKKKFKINYFLEWPFEIIIITIIITTNLFLTFSLPFMLFFLSRSWRFINYDFIKHKIGTTYKIFAGKSLFLFPIIEWWLDIFLIEPVVVAMRNFFVIVGIEMERTVKCGEI
jgi:hypothetical protein